MANFVHSFLINMINLGNAGDTRLEPINLPKFYQISLHMYPFVLHGVISFYLKKKQDWKNFTQTLLEMTQKTIKWLVMIIRQLPLPLPPPLPMDRE